MKRHKFFNYGYKVCYKYKHKKHLTCRFITYSYKVAKSIKAMYQRYPPPNKNNVLLNNVIWEIYPITKKESKYGIWLECPF